ncbi:cytochrome P450 2U1 [Strongylocentrotus purpuratus]|uniref:Cytochrome P450 n=1 Tax=Strongylocentrotus purpuratus TaxID=7668 RepID=A0A7M7NCK1_STRPU|nr:cytochrome P450 2U1 [Strongylocentrotus purpuratus]
MIVISDGDLLREALIKQANIFSDRKVNGLISVSFPVEGSIAWQNGDPWKEHRRFMNRTLRTLGMGRSLMGKRINDECLNMCDYVDKLEGNPINPDQMMTTMTCNIMNAVALGKRYDFNDPRFVKLRRDCKEILDNLSNTSIYNMLPFLYHTRLCKRYREAVENVTIYVKNEVIEHDKSFNNNSLRDVIDYYLREVKRGSRVTDEEDDDDEKDNEHTCSFINDQFCWRGVLDLLIAGVDTTSNHTMWTMLHMAYYPEIQEKAQAQIDQVVGRDRLPTLDDQPRLPLVTAIAREVLRTSIGTTTVPHHTTQDTYLKEFFIPKGTQVLGNLWSLNHDPEVFEDPYVFRPSRFLAEDGSLQGLSDVKSFGIGPRKCPGEPMAQQECFLIMAILLHRYNLVFPEGDPIPDIRGRVKGMMLLPDKYRLRFIRR